MIKTTSQIRARRVRVAVGIGIGVLCGVGAAPAYAVNTTPAPDPGASGITATDPGTISASEEQDQGAIDARLTKLSKTQTRAEVDAIMQSGRRYDALLTDAGYVAAIPVDEPFYAKFQAVSVRGPGCSTGDACATSSSGINFGYYGTGSRDINITNITHIYGGNRTTTFWRNVPGGSSGDFIAANARTVTVPAHHYLRITRTN